MIRIFCLVIIVFLAEGQVDPLKFKWGTYKPQFIHAITERNIKTFNPLTIQFYYFLNDRVQWEKSLKSKVSDMSQDKEIFNYVAHDGERFSVHQITDTDYDVHLQHDFMKLNHGVVEDWVTTVFNTDYLEGDSDQVSLVYSVALEKLNSQITDLRKITISEDGESLRVKISDLSDQDRYLYISLKSNGVVVPLPGNQNFGFSLLVQPNSQLNWNLRTQLYNEIRKNRSSHRMGYDLSAQETGNALFLQYVGRKNEQFSLQLRYSEEELQYHENGYYFDYSGLKRQLLIDFNRQFKSTFTKPGLNNFHLECSKSSFSNLMGGYIMAYGDLLCENNEAKCREQKMMLTTTPSREGFPRPFLWDDGFHNMVNCKWNPQLCLQSLTDWFDTMLDDGWIPREQPRGDELRSYFPAHFDGLYQKRRETNPPTFIFNFMYLDSVVSTKPGISLQIRKLWPKLTQWYEFWITSQASKTNQYLFKWWGPNDDINYGSGMDDWPRSTQGYIGLYNVDASIWGWVFTNKMYKLSRNYEPQKTEYYKSTADSIKRNIIQYLYDSSDGIYKDVLQGNKPNTFNTTIKSPHIGYPNLLPLAFGFVDQIDKYLDLLTSDKLWTPYGIRSLSNTDEYFGKGDNYWRGPIWIPINYLILRGLYKYYRNNERANRVYTELRENIIHNVCGNWRDTGFFYEHFSQKQDGKGHGHHPFNGWTSIVTLIIGDNYD